MHDFQKATAMAARALLDELRAQGYKVVHMKAKAPLATIAQWDDAARSQIKGLPAGAERPTSSVVHTIEAALPATAAVKTLPTK